jgi:hypothetical protein
LLGTGKKVEENDVDPTEIDASIFNEKVQPNLIKYLFTIEAWNRFQSFYVEKKRQLQHHCGSCYQSDDSNENLKTCDHCMLSFHYLCVKAKKSARKGTWFCNRCKAEAKSAMIREDEDNIE